LKLELGELLQLCLGVPQECESPANGSRKRYENGNTFDICDEIHLHRRRHLTLFFTGKEVAAGDFAKMTAYSAFGDDARSASSVERGY
jgi:hypothetical protein